MKKCLWAILIATFLPAISYGQEDIDIEFGFDDFTNPTEIEVEFDQLTTEGLGFTDGAFEELFGNDLETENPGFITPATEGGGETGRFNPGDQVNILFLDAAASSDTNLGQGFVTFFNPATGALEASPTDITIESQLDGSSTLSGTSITGSNSLLISEASDGFLVSNAADPDENLTLGLGEIHNHLNFDLDDATAQVGAFGLLLQFEADIAGPDGNVDGIAEFTSDPFFLIFNNGLSEEEFGTALVAFGAPEAIPEPAAGLVLTAVAGAIMTRRRRRT